VLEHIRPHVRHFFSHLRRLLPSGPVDDSAALMVALARAIVEIDVAMAARDAPSPMAPAAPQERLRETLAQWIAVSARAAVRKRPRAVQLNPFGRAASMGDKQDGLVTDYYR